MVILLERGIRGDTCTGKPTPFMIGASDGHTYLNCSVLIGTSMLLLGGSTGSSILATPTQALAPIFLIVDLDGDLESANTAYQIKTGGFDSTEVTHCSDDKQDNNMAYMFLQNPSALFRYDLGTGVKQTLLFRESTSPGSLVMPNLYTNMLFAFDEVFMAGYYLDSSSVHNYYVLSINANTSSLNSVLYRRKIDLTGCNTIQSGPWIPTS